MNFPDMGEIMKYKLNRKLLRSVSELANSYSNLDYPEVMQLSEGKFETVAQLYKISKKLMKKRKES